MRRWAVLAVMLASCGKEPEAPVASPAPSSTSTPMPVDEPAAPEPPARPAGPRPAPPEPPVAPQLDLTVNGSDVPEVPKGTPILLELWLNAPVEQALTLHAAGGSWASFAQLETPGPAWAFRPALQVGPTVRLDSTNGAVLVWTLPAKTVDTLPRGEYSIGVKLDTRQGAAPDSWVGLVHPPPIRVRLTAEPPSPPRIDLLVRCALWERRNDEALKLVEKEVTDQPDSPQLFALKAEVLEVAGKPKEALQALDQAIAKAAAAGSPVRSYLSLRTALQRRMESRGK